MNPVVFSASSVNAYLDCHLRWYFTYVLNMEGEQSEAQRVGIAVHDYAEKRLRGENTTILRPVDHLLAVHGAAAVFDRDILPTYRDPVLIEAAFQIEVNGIPFSGIIDSVDRHDIGFENAETEYANILRDLKTTGSRPKAGRYHFNMVGYWLGARELGFTPEIMQLDYIVRTKKPYYWPEVVAAPDEDEIAVFAAVLDGVARGVERADYQPTALGTRTCVSCQHRASCGPYQRYKEVTDA